MENNFLRGQKEVKKHKLRSQIAITNLNRKIANWGFCVDTLIAAKYEDNGDVEHYLVPSSSNKAG